LKKLSKKRKKFLENRSARILRHRSRRKNKIQNDSSTSLKTKLSRNPEFKEVRAPTNLTLQYEDVEEVLRFIKTIKRLGHKGYFPDLKLEGVKKIGEGAIAMLLSVISDLERNRIFSKGNKPDDEHCRDTLEKSGFFRHMNASISKKNSVSKSRILKTGSILTQQDELVPEIHKSMETIWGKSARCPALYGGLGEMMRNSCDHAFSNKRSVIWHLGITHFEKDNNCKFSFVDNGDGIISTYNRKGIFKKIASFFTDNGDILETAFKDGIQSRTGLSWRGKGLPTIFEMYSDKIITNLVVITNDVYLDFDRGINKSLKTDFSGTYYFWRIDNSCIPSYFE